MSKKGSERSWQKYIEKNRTEGDCQLVTACNAYYYLTGKTVDDKTYDNYVDFCGCRYGSAVAIEKVWEELGIEVVWEGLSLSNLFEDKQYKWSAMGVAPLPIEFNVQAKHYGFHSTLIVDYLAKANCYRVTNFKYHTTWDGWLFEEVMDQFETFCTQRDLTTYRLFGLKGDKKYRVLKRKSKQNKKKFFEVYKKFYADRLEGK